MRSFFRRHPRKHLTALTLVELLVTLTILLVMLVGILEFVTMVEGAWKSGSTDPFAEAENAFETMARNLAAATLEPYQDYADRTGQFQTAAGFVPDHLTRRSDLDFICGPSGNTGGLLAASKRITAGSAVFFLAPTGYTQSFSHSGMERLLNALGYFVEFGDDTSAPAFILPTTHSWRWRLRQVLQPAESLQIFATTDSTTWVQPLVQAGASTSVLAENVITLIILPERSATDTGTPLSPDFRYDSRDASQPLTRHQLPPRLRLVLVAIDETSAQRLALQYGSTPPPLVPAALFQTASQLDTELGSLDAMLTAQKIGHRIFQRHLLLPSAAWSETASQ
jgi:uncharacterized protein (TIGR02599 family)